MSDQSHDKSAREKMAEHLRMRQMQAFIELVYDDPDGLADVLSSPSHELPCVSVNDDKAPLRRPTVAELEGILAQPSSTRRTEALIAKDAIDLFCEYRDKHGYSEESAAVFAVNEFTEAEHFAPSATVTPEINPEALPSLPGQKPITVVMHKDDGDVQADAAIEAVKRGDTFLMPLGVSELFFHQLRLRVALEPSLADKIAVYYLIPGERRYQEVRLGFKDELRWPVDFLHDGFVKEIEITSVREVSGESGSRQPSDDTKARVAKLREKYGVNRDGGTAPKEKP